GKRNLLNLSFQKFDIVRPGFVLVLIREREHFIGHVESVCFASWTDALRRQKNVDAAARSEVENRLAFIEFGECSRISAAERSKECFGRDAGFLLFVVELGSDRIPC